MFGNSRFSQSHKPHWGMLQKVQQLTQRHRACVFDVLVILQLKKSIKPPEMPSKHVRNWVPKVLEQRRQGLELYLQVARRTFAHTETRKL